MHQPLQVVEVSEDDRILRSVLQQLLPEEPVKVQVELVVGVAVIVELVDETQLGQGKKGRYEEFSSRVVLLLETSECTVINYLDSRADMDVDNFPGENKELKDQVYLPYTFHSQSQLI